MAQSSSLPIIPILPTQNWLCFLAHDLNVTKDSLYCQAGFTLGPEGERRPVIKVHVFLGPLIFTESVCNTTVCGHIGL